MDGKDSILRQLKNKNQIADDLNIFIRELSNTTSFTSNQHHSAYLCSDFNIDLLRMDTHHFYNDFLRL